MLKYDDKSIKYYKP